MCCGSSKLKPFFILKFYVNVERNVQIFGRFTPLGQLVSRRIKYYFLQKNSADLRRRTLDLIVSTELIRLNANRREKRITAAFSSALA